MVYNTENRIFLSNSILYDPKNQQTNFAAMKNSKDKRISQKILSG